MRLLFPILCAASAIPATSAHAFCMYHDKMYAKTSVAQEFHDAKLVVKAKVEAADYHWSNEGDSWAIYTVRVITRFKGPPSHTLRLFTFRDSGGFYLDKGVAPALDTDYLLFLVPPTQARPHGVTDVVQVNYACGQSKPWTEVTSAEQASLSRRATR